MTTIEPPAPRRVGHTLEAQRAEQAAAADAYRAELRQRELRERLERTVD